MSVLTNKSSIIIVEIQPLFNTSWIHGRVHFTPNANIHHEKFFTIHSSTKYSNTVSRKKVGGVNVMGEKDRMVAS